MNKKLIRNVSVVALSAVMMAGTAAVFAGCGGGGNDATMSYQITVNIFCDPTDAATNEQICKAWEEEYNAKLHRTNAIPEDKNVEVKFTSQSSTESYFTELENQFVRGKAADIIYVQPAKVRSWAERGRIMDLSAYINMSEGSDYEENVANIKGLWQDCLSFYGYSPKEGYTLGDTIQYYAQGDTLTNGTTISSKNAAGFYSVSNPELGTVGVYGLPKDYSNFTLGFNNRYFSDALKLAYMTIPVNTERNVVGAVDRPANQNYTGVQDDQVVTYAVSGDYTITNPLTGEKIEMEAVAGAPAPLINPGVPTVYKPYNFYAFSNFDDALAGGDPVAKAVNEYTKGAGYVVTLPGFPGDTFSTEGFDNLDANAPYDTSIGHITFTYAEYSALTWAVTYFCNTFNFRSIQDASANELKYVNGELQYPEALTGNASTKVTSGVYKANGQGREAVFGNDQYEGLPNPTLYLLPWLAGNDANFINTSSDTAINAVRTASSVDDERLSDGEYSFEMADGTKGVNWDRMKVAEDSRGGQIYEIVQKLRLSGEWEDVAVQYGLNSERFIETYGAFLAYGSDWNGNSGNAGALAKEKPDNGWALFRDGACIFYGAGTWDNKTKNESPIIVNYANADHADETFCEYRSMPVPVGEQYALYSRIKDAFYEYTTYANGAGGRVSGSASDQLKIYDKESIIANQMIRQDKWGARMDSVGFALNDSVRKLAERTEAAAWKLQGCAELIMRLSANEQAQHDLTLGGAQLPNFRQQCVEFLNYQKAGYENGSFSDMISPEGFATTKYWKEGKVGLEARPEGEAEAKAIWRAYIDVVEAINTSTDRNLKVVDWFNAHYPDGVIDAKYKLEDGTVVPLKWDTQFNNQTLASVLTGTDSVRASAMKLLKMVTYTYADRDQQLRMQYGMNAVRDCAMYTYENTWIADITLRGRNGWAYRNQEPITALISSLIVTNPQATAQDLLARQYYSPAFFCFYRAEQVQKDLEQSIKHEAESLTRK